MNKLRIGDKVKLNKKEIINHEELYNAYKEDLDRDYKIIGYTFDEEIQEIVFMIDIDPYSKWHGIGIYGKYISTIPRFTSEFLVKEKIEKTNKIRRTQTGSIIEYKIDNMDLCFEITDHPMNLSVALNLLLHETELYNFKYERVSPFKITKKYNKDREGHIFTIDFIDIRNKENVSTELLRTDKGMRLDGKYKIFIPDFLEICAKLNILERSENGYKLLNNLSNVMDGCEYIEKSLEEKLKLEGYTIPKGWNKYK